MKTQFVLTAAAACFCVVSCATDPALAEKKKSVSIGRFGVSQGAAAPEPEASPETVAPSGPAVSAPAATVVEQEAPPKKTGGFFSWFRKDKTEDAPAAVPVQEKPAEPKATEPVKREAVVDFKEPSKKKPLSDDIRLPGMLGMPEDKDFKATNPSVPKSGEGGSVISRPPVEKKKE